MRLASDRSWRFNGRMDVKANRRRSLADLEDEYGSLAAVERATHRDGEEGVAASYLSQVKIGFRQMGDRIARKLESRLGLPHGWMDEEHKGKHRAVGATAKPPTPPVEAAVEEGEDEWPVARLDVRASAGRDGITRPGHDPVAGYMHLNPAWIRQNLPDITSPRNLRVITAYGDSMAPRFQDGDPLIVDAGVREVRLDAIYVFTLDDELFIKILQRIPGNGLKVISVNKTYDPYVLNEASKCEMAVLGRVVWAWRGERL